MNRLAILDRLHAVPFLRRLPPSRLDRLVSESEVRHFEPGSLLLEEGVPGECVLLVLEGRAVVSKRLAPGGEEVTLAVRGPGDWVGEMALLDEGPRSASVRAHGPVLALEVPRGAFLGAVGSVPEAALDLLRVLSQRLRASDRDTIAALTAKAEALEQENQRLARANRRLSEQLAGPSGFDAFVGGSAAARTVREFARRAADSELPVLILGETGTGKEVLARAIHAAGDRPARPFVAVNCALLSETLLESELFGHVRGAFTGATATKQGLVEVADGGTLFLDEIGDMPRAIQGALLRFLELGEYRRVGDTRTRRARVRVVAATHDDLDAAVEAGRFRRDLLYRLDVIRIEIPPLRERPEDLPLLVRHLNERIAQRLGRPPLVLAPSAHEALARYAFPGNVRELENELERLYACAPPGEVVEADWLSRRIRAPEGQRTGGYAEALRAFKIELVERALSESGGSRTEAARRLGVHRSNLVRMMRDLGLREGRRGTPAP